MKEFLLSMVSPLKMKKYRFMTVFIALLIFITTTYVITIPHTVYVNNHKDKFMSANSYVNLYMDLPSIDLGEEFKAAQYKVEKVTEDKKEVLQLKTTLADKGITNYKYTFDKVVNEGKKDEEVRNIKLYLAFDVKNSIYSKLKEIQDKYAGIYKDDSKNKISYAGYLCYVDMLKQETVTDEWMTSKLQELHDTEEKDLAEKMSKLTNFDLFNISEYDKDTYLLMFFKDNVTTQIPVYNEKEKTSQYPSQTVAYDTFDMLFDFTTMNNLDEFGDQFINFMFKPFFNQEKTGYLLQTVGYTIIFPLLYALILFWCMKKRGVMKTYKEYFNVASIASVIPAIITFIVSWFIPNAIIIYGALFCLATLAVYIKINSTPELLDA